MWEYLVPCLNSPSSPLWDKPQPLHFQDLLPASRRLFVGGEAWEDLADAHGRCRLAAGGLGVCSLY